MALATERTGAPSLYSVGSRAWRPHADTKPQQDRSLIIVDDSYDLVEAVALTFGGNYQDGLLAEADFGAALLSMSGYEKSSIPNFNEYDDSRPLENNVSPADYDASRSVQHPMYLAYAEPAYVEHQVQPLSSTADQMVFGTSSYYHPTTNYEVDQPHFSDYESRKPPEVTSYNPPRGLQGSQVFVHIESIHNLSTQPLLKLSLMFAAKSCPSFLTRLEPRGASYRYVLTTEAPPLSSTGWSSPLVPLRIQLHDESGLDVGVVDVGTFYYNNEVNHHGLASPEDSSRKRKISVDSSELIRVPAKRASNQQLDAGTYHANPYTQSESLAYSKTSQSNPLNSAPEGPVSYGRSHSQRQYHQSDTSKRSSQSFTAKPASAQSLMKAPSPQASSCGSSYAPINHPGASSGLPGALASRISSISSPPSSANPPLIRTSTLQQSPGAAGTPSTPNTRGSFNPYALYPGHKAVLKIHGDLESMVDHWTPEEDATKRRIVQFWRSQDGNTINTNFEPVAADDRPPSSICISCILWEERQEYFVTSVDTIFLLEALVAVRFGVEEKNRIRRNLEGFRPMTVSKAKSDSENFFKVIMGLPAPKPRNIEKDVKVFPWKILAHALKKIIGKYSASYASTASAIFPPHNRGYSFGGQSEATAPTEQAITSPHSSSNSTISSAYTTTLASTTLSPSLSHGRLSTPAQYPDAANVPPPIPRRTHAYAVPSTSQYQYASQEQLDTSLGQLPMTSQPSRDSLDFTSFLETSPTMSNPSNLQPIHRFRGESLNPASSQAPSSKPNVR